MDVWYSSWAIVSSLHPYFILYYIILSYLIYLILSYLILSYLILSYLGMSKRSTEGHRTTTTFTQCNGQTLLFSRPRAALQLDGVDPLIAETSWCNSTNRQGLSIQKIQFFYNRATPSSLNHVVIYLPATLSWHETECWWTLRYQLLGPNRWYLKLHVHVRQKPSYSP